VKLLESILSGANPSYGKAGYYLASSGSVAWLDIYTAIAKALAVRKVVESEEVKEANDAALDNMAQALGCPKTLIPVQVGGK
jgi:D-ribose pyranose/furanose isomerase RbsD